MVTNLTTVTILYTTTTSERTRVHFSLTRARCWGPTGKIIDKIYSFRGKAR